MRERIHDLYFYSTSIFHSGALACSLSHLARRPKECLSVAAEGVLQHLRASCVHDGGERLHGVAGTRRGRSTPQRERKKRKFVSFARQLYTLSFKRVLYLRETHREAGGSVVGHDVVFLQTPPFYLTWLDRLLRHATAYSSLSNGRNTLPS
jgi:hypothetical protein